MATASHLWSQIPSPSDASLTKNTMSGDHPIYLGLCGDIRPVEPLSGGLPLSSHESVLDGSIGGNSRLGNGTMMRSKTGIGVIRISQAFPCLTVVV